MLLTDIITRPIRILQKQMLAVEKGDLEVKVQVEGQNEFSELGKSFNEMIKKIKLLVENNNIEHEKLKKAELNIMQAQINPHFLYNSLDAIVWMAEGGDKDRIIDLVTALSGFFRISLSKGADIITLEKEIEHCKNYLIIQKMRYGELLSYNIYIDERILNEKIIKITLQPIVENAIYHGIKNKE
ncbi:MAG: histidine kinase [Leptotrichiaceae bacterium]|nr:histidine kinase [Leptotrichiaceae bacterium]